MLIAWSQILSVRSGSAQAKKALIILNKNPKRHTGVELQLRANLINTMC